MAATSNGRMQIEVRELAGVNWAPYNPRRRLKPGSRYYESLRRSIQEFGLVEPLVYNEKTGNLVGGHQRMQILRDLGEQEAEMVVVNLDPDREKALNVALNKVTGEWDNDALATVLADIDASPVDVALTGFEGTELERLLAESQPDDPEYEFTEELLEEHQYVVLYFDNSVDWQAAVETLGVETVKALDSKPGYERKGKGRVVRGADVIRRINR